ncbi:unnamed protein product [Rhizophagus irregularis]|nr:unnamed protein product [Rhizophagus irregularis]
MVKISSLSHMIKKESLSVIRKNVSTEDIVQKLDGKEMEFQELFEEYFQDELNNKNFIVNNIHIIAIIPVTAPVSAIAKRKTEEFNLGEENISQNSKKERLTGFTSRSTPESIVEYLLEQKGLKDDFIKLARDNKLDLNDKIFYPLFALQSTPGGGKSYFLDEFAL